MTTTHLAPAEGPRRTFQEMVSMYTGKARQRSRWQKGRFRIGISDASAGTGHRYRSVHFGIMKPGVGDRSWFYVHGSDVRYGISGKANRSFSVSVSVGRIHFLYTGSKDRDIPKVYNDWRERLAAREAVVSES